ncbi:MAG: hypothetical protein R3C08_02955 [Hyphomonas sp.]
MRPNRDGSPPNVRTKGAYVEKARNGVMEFLPSTTRWTTRSVTRAARCDLQDQAMAYGRPTSRYDENKRAVEDKYMGPLVKTIMTAAFSARVASASSRKSPAWKRSA